MLFLLFTIERTVMSPRGGVNRRTYKFHTNVADFKFTVCQTRNFRISKSRASGFRLDKR